MEPDPFQQRLFDQGNTFEAAVVAELLAVHPGAVSVAGGGQTAEAATLEAMGAGVSLILNARLRDDVGRRVGKPDLLVATPAGGYRALDVKWHMALDVAEPSRDSVPAMVSGLDDLVWERATADSAFTVRKHQGDALQLAHYQRMLEALGMASPDGRYGATLGTEQRAVWYDLDAPLWRTPSVSETTKMRSTLERYDFEFDFRLDIIAVAHQHERDSSTELLVVPVRCGECPTCPWLDYCRPILETPPGDVSLLPRVGWTQWKVHHDRGVMDRAQLAALDPATAQVIAARLDAAALMGAVEDLAPTTPIEDLVGIWLKPKDAGQLRALGIDTFGDVQALDPATARYSNTGMAALPEQIDMARAALGAAPVYRRRGVDRIVIPRADVEVDVDMENIESGVYLWGTLLGGSGSEGGRYMPFVSWMPLTPENELSNSLAFWRRLMALRADARARGLGFAAYCWNASAENQYLRKLGLAGGIAEEVDEFIASDEWVDLLKVWDTQLITGGPSGLKVVAALGGIHWEVDDPGGGESMVKYDIAVGPGPEAEAAREWLLTYNRGDVMATRSIRDWMGATDTPAIESAKASNL